jgi:hypothetical protein
MPVPLAWIDATWEHHLRRLRALEVPAIELDAASTRILLRRFVEEFGDPDHGTDMLAVPPDRAIHFERWVRPDCLTPGRAEGSVVWLSGGKDDARCVRFERRRRLPALEIDLGAMQDAWVASWPGAFVNFDRARALVVSIDYEAFRCDPRRFRESPYR